MPTDDQDNTRPDTTGASGVLPRPSRLLFILQHGHQKCAGESGHGSAAVDRWPYPIEGKHPLNQVS
jgi:hypothetical protein